MSVRQTFRRTIRSLIQEYKNVEFSDKVLDIISLLGLLFFLISLFSTYLISGFNVINVIFVMYPLGIAGLAATFRMKRRDDPEKTEGLFKEWLIINIGFLAIIAIILVIAIALY